MGLVVPAVLPSSRENLEDGLILLSSIPSINRVQIDVVDGRFASPASWPYSAPAELEAMVQKGEMLPLLNCFDYEIDLMCFDAERAAEEWLALGAMAITAYAYADGPYKTIEPEDLTEAVSKWFVIIPNLILGLLVIFFSINLVKTVSNVRSGQEDAADKAWKWGGMLAFCMAGLAVLNIWALNAGVFE